MVGRFIKEKMGNETSSLGCSFCIHGCTVYAIMLIDVLLFGSEWVGAQLSPTLDLDLKSIHQKIVLIEVLHRSYYTMYVTSLRYNTIT